MSLPNPRDVLASLGVPDAWNGNPPGWDRAMSAMPEGPFPFLDKARIPGLCRDCGLAADRAALLAPLADIIAADPALRAYAWYMHWRVFDVPDYDEMVWAPQLKKRLAALAGMFYLLLSLDLGARLSARHRSFGYPPEVTPETLRQIACFDSIHASGEGVPGLHGPNYIWLGSYLRKPYVRLGRLEYRLNGYVGGISVWRRQADGAVLALADFEGRVAEDGMGVRPGSPPGSGWATSLVQTATTVTGNPIDPCGRVLHREVSLPLSGWERVLVEGDPILELHIPSGGGMDWDSVVSSLRQAAVFFPKYHPDRPFRALATGTWFMDPRLADLLPADSNLLRFQRAVYMFPQPPHPDGLWHVFLRPVADTPPDSLPAETSLQRALIGFLKGGGIWHGGNLFMLPEEMANPRENAYREHFAVLSREFGFP